LVRKAVPVVRGKTERETAERIAQLAVSPEMSSQRVVAASEGNNGLEEHLDIPQLMAVLKTESERLSEGKSEDVGPILANQALALQSLFSRLTERALSHSHVSNIEAFMRLALRAQNQCRATLETLSSFNKAPTVFAQQANVATNQQINYSQNQLSGDDDELRQDTRAPGAEKAVNPEMETLGEVDGAKNS
jgi:hypothetical protein